MPEVRIRETGQARGYPRRGEIEADPWDRRSMPEARREPTTDAWDHGRVEKDMSVSRNIFNK
jgi:hypothetical protein